MLYDRCRRRTTKTIVAIYDTADISCEDQPYTLICEGPNPDTDEGTHGGVLTVDTQAQAWAWAPHPEEWCPYCQDETNITTEEE